MTEVLHSAIKEDSRKNIYVPRISVDTHQDKSAAAEAERGGSLVNHIRTDNSSHISTRRAHSLHFLHPLSFLFPKIQPLINLDEIQRVTTDLNILHDHRLGECSMNLLLYLIQFDVRSNFSSK